MRTQESMISSVGCAIFVNQYFKHAVHGCVMLERKVNFEVQVNFFDINAFEILETGRIATKPIHNAKKLRPYVFQVKPRWHIAVHIVAKVVIAQ